MDLRDHLRALTDGLAWTVCNEPVPVDRIQRLARREALIDSPGDLRSLFATMQRAASPPSERGRLG